MTSKQKRIGYTLAVVPLTLSVLAGCASSTTTSSATSSPQASAAATSSTASTAPKTTTTIKVWTLNRHDQDYMQNMVDTFNKSNKDGIKIDYQIYSENYNQSLDIAMSTNEGPDVFFDGGTAYADHLPKGDLLPLDKYLTPEFKQRFGDGAFLDGVNMKDGKTYSIPAIGSTARLFYNKGIFEKAGIAGPPKTMAELTADAKQITDKLKGQGIYGFAMNLKSPGSAFGRSLEFVNMRNGGVYGGYDFKQGKYDFSSYKPTLNAFKDLYSSGAMFPGSTSLDIDPLRTQFAAGKIGMYFGLTHAEPGVYTTQFPTKEDWDVAPIPTIDGTVKGAQQIIVAGRWFLANAHTQHPDEAWKVMNYLYSDELLTGYHEKGLGIVMVPSVISHAKQSDNLKKWPALGFTDTDKVYPPNPTGVQAQGNDSAFVMNAIIQGAQDIDKGIADLNTRYNDAYDKAIAAGKTAKIQYPNFDPMNPGKSASK
ncbi:hypothetical protein A8709_28245 [Paenibacillus pectinilyticus]|uniref:ABC transporter substrate-binding protein n=2 Tax=Paenibacillus pectinilyticus TaxID=512399 RepID=A0A1C0ZXG4_9BACL|nr:hypothetical protein A8709_28245 [Paenibacillus pectinilyticus]